MLLEHFYSVRLESLVAHSWTNLGKFLDCSVKSYADRFGKGPITAATAPRHLSRELCRDLYRDSDCPDSYLYDLKDEIGVQCLRSLYHQ